jgi:outer membrane protein OmpA-like peptidoglycan-associated protein
MRSWLVTPLVLFALVTTVAADGLGSKNPGLYNLRGQIYFLAEGADHMPADIDKQKVEGVIYTESLDVPAREFTTGFPGVTNRFEWFGVIYTGTFQLPKAGKYKFRSTSDDGIIMWIDGKKVLELDSIHGPEDATGEVSLKAGAHAIKVWYFQGPANEIAIQLFITPPGGTEKIFSMKDYAGDSGKAFSDLGGEATPAGIRIRLDAGVLFDVDKAVLKPAAKKTLTKLATALKNYPTAAVTVDGFTSSEGEAAHNQTLSENRANAVKVALTKLVPKTMTLTALGHGAESPIADNKTEKTRAPNRRVETLVKP